MGKWVLLQREDNETRVWTEFTTPTDDPPPFTAYQETIRQSSTGTQWWLARLEYEVRLQPITIHLVGIREVSDVR